MNTPGRPVASLPTLVMLTALMLCPLLAGCSGPPTPAATPGVASTSPEITSRTLDNLLLLDIERVSERRLAAVGGRGYILLSDDDGQHWQQATTSLTSPLTLTALTFIDGQSGWVVGHDHAILHSADGGKTWQQQHLDQKQEAPLLDVLFLDRQHGFAVGAYGSFLETQDGGKTWIQRSIVDSDRHFNAISGDAGQLLIAGEGGLLLSSTDAGATWNELPSPYKGSFFGTLQLADRSWLIFGMRGHIYHSTDAGGSWQPIPHEGTAFLMGGKAETDGRVTLTDLGGTLLQSKDMGRSFSRLNTPANKAYAQVLPLPDNGFLLAGEGGVTPVRP